MAQTRYLLKVYELTNAGDSSTTTSELAKAMNVSDASVSEAIGKLEDRNLVCRAPYKGFTLSPMGKNEAEQLNKKLEVLKTFLGDTLGVEKAGQQAEQISEHLTEETIQKLEELNEQD